VIVNHSLKLNSAKRSYPDHDGELLAVVEATREWRHYCLGRRFKVLTNDWAAEHIQTQSRLNPGRQARLVQKLLDFEFTLEHIWGEANTAAVAHSGRAAYVFRHEEVITLPGCASVGHKHVRFPTLVSVIQPESFLIRVAECAHRDAE
jgi:hypothetical protein